VPGLRLKKARLEANFKDFEKSFAAIFKKRKRIFKGKYEAKGRL
jgi:hypothetical protein